MRQNIFTPILCLFLSYSYSQDVKLLIDTGKLDSITTSLYSKILQGINENEIMDRSSHIIKGFENISAANDKTMSVIATPIIKINILKNTKDNYVLISEKPLDIYAKPSPFNDKIYSYEIETDSNNTGLLGNYSANFVTSALRVIKGYKPICFAYFLEKDRYLNNFLILENSENEFIVVDRKLNLFQNINDFIKYHYDGSIENLLWLIETKNKKNENIVLYVINDSIVIDQEIIFNPKNIEKFEILNFENEKVEDNKSLWKYDIIIGINLKPKTKLLNIEQFYKEYHIGDKNQNLKLCIDDKLKTKNLLIDLSVIAKAEVVEGFYTVNGVNSTIREKYINIRTNFK